MQFKDKASYLTAVNILRNSVLNKHNSVSAFFIQQGKMRSIRRYDMVRKGSYILSEGGASLCVIVILYDRKKKIGSISHYAEPNTLRMQLPKIVMQMKKLGATNIVSCVLGGSTWHDKAAALKNWKEAPVLLKKLGIKKAKISAFKDVAVEFAALWTGTGKVVYAIEKFNKNIYYVGEFFM